MKNILIRCLFAFCGLFSITSVVAEPLSKVISPTTHVKAERATLAESSRTLISRLLNQISDSNDDLEEIPNALTSLDIGSLKSPINYNVIFDFRLLKTRLSSASQQHWFKRLMIAEYVNFLFTKQLITYNKQRVEAS